MSKKNIDPKTEQTIIKDAAQLWRFLEQGAGVDTKYYDKEIFNSKDPDLNLYSLLGIKSTYGSVEENLVAGGVSTEAFLQVLLKAFQPYSLMMVEVCAFFEKYQAKYSAENIKIQFNFDKELSDVGFNLEHFRQTLHHFQVLERELTVYEITANQISKLNRILTYDSGITIENALARDWMRAHRPNGRTAVFNKPDVGAPVTGHDELDHYLAVLMDIWHSFVNSCRQYGHTLDDLENAAGGRGETDRDKNVLNDVKLLRQQAQDYWPEFFLGRLFGRVQEIKKMHDGNRKMQLNLLCNDLKKIVSSLGKNTVTIKEKKSVKELLNLLSLPVWRKRHELYSTWILTRIDKAFEGCQVELHHQEGRLALGFKQAHILSIETRDEILELWCEVRSPLENPSSEKRKEAVQPDYRILPAGSVASPEKHIAAVEVKQHKSTSRKNFLEALNDYAVALPNALIVLANYGPVSKHLPLVFPQRSIYMGKIRPDGDNAYKLTERLSALISKPEQENADVRDYLDAQQQALFLSSEIDEIFVDISGSLNNQAYRAFLVAMLCGRAIKGGLKKIAAVNTELRKEWNSPDPSALKELTAMEFSGDTRFDKLVPKNSPKSMIITDKQGYIECVQKRVTAGCCLIYSNGKAEFKKIG
ncbi:hypothetical protein L1276_002560 [Flavobacterium sp. HSC-32F16]|uniref:hypothetical protein n=1 Tax=Flavobacterium sp. HSC-32F16 TaxID=2910964 RepID=UPI0020A26C8B|nr:hypothetical protein [Flavobacterium sp. HSC-32F16]MCP2027403.1 hypothetical protein [Flavobacterium sp. HSC-32F16]